MTDAIREKAKEAAVRPFARAFCCPPNGCDAPQQTCDAHSGNEVFDKRILAALGPALDAYEATMWQTMESAPKDGWFLAEWEDGWIELMGPHFHRGPGCRRWRPLPLPPKEETRP